MFQRIPLFSESNWLPHLHLKRIRQKLFFQRHLRPNKSKCAVPKGARICEECKLGRTAIVAQQDGQWPNIQTFNLQAQHPHCKEALHLRWRRLRSKWGTELETTLKQSGDQMRNETNMQSTCIKDQLKVSLYSTLVTLESQQVPSWPDAFNRKPALPAVVSAYSSVLGTQESTGNMTLK